MITRNLSVFASLVGLFFSVGAVLFAGPDDVSEEMKLSGYTLSMVPRGSARRAITFKDGEGVIERVHSALEFHGYTELGWFVVDLQEEVPIEVAIVDSRPPSPQSEGQNNHDALAVLTKLERFDQTSGKPIPGERWNVNTDGKEQLPFRELLARALNGRPPGYFRVFLLTLGKEPAPNKGNWSEAASSLVELRRKGHRSWSVKALKNVTEIHALTLIVYEFLKDPNTGKIAFVPDSSMGVDFHIDGAGLSELFDTKTYPNASSAASVHE